MKNKISVRDPAVIALNILSARNDKWRIHRTDNHTNWYVYTIHHRAKRRGQEYVWAEVTTTNNVKSVVVNFMKFPDSYNHIRMKYAESIVSALVNMGIKATVRIKVDPDNVSEV